MAGLGVAEPEPEVNADDKTSVVPRDPYFARSKQKEGYGTNYIPYMFFAGIFGEIPTVAKAPEYVIVSRIFVGLHTGMGISLTSLYLAEISPKRIRGAVGLPKLAGTLRCMASFVCFNAGPALVCLPFQPYFPESQRYLLIKKNDNSGAKNAMDKLRGEDMIDEEIEEMKIEARRALFLETFT